MLSTAMRIETARRIRKQAEAPKIGLQVNTVVSREAKPAIKRITDIFEAASDLSIIFVVIVSVPVFMLSAAVLNCCFSFELRCKYTTLF